MQLDREDIEAIAQRVVDILEENRNRLLTMKEAAEILKINATEKSLPSIFSRLTSRRHYEKPLVAHKVGRQRSFKRQDVLEFMSNRKRN